MSAEEERLSESQVRMDVDKLKRQDAERRDKDAMTKCIMRGVVSYGQGQRVREKWSTLRENEGGMVGHWQRV